MSSSPDLDRRVRLSYAISVAALIDHTLLRADATRLQIEKLCDEAARFKFVTVCVNSWNVPLASEFGQSSNVKVCAVVGFPLGATLPQVKVFEAEEAMKSGACEIDVVQNIGALKSGNDKQVEADIRGIVEACHRQMAVCKVILEMSLLSAEEKIRAALLAKQAGADFVKTSTGFGVSGATTEDVALLRAIVGKDMGVKAAGGIRTLEDLEKMKSAGASRIGTSAGVRIIQQAREGFA